MKTPLPIDSSLPEILARLRESRALVLSAPPGSGKTTRVPPALLASGLLAIAHPAIVLLQPRRVAARAAARRIADENGWTLGEEVGYQIRFEKRVGPRTLLRVETEGILNRQLAADPFLEGIGAVVLDEFHERSLHTDLALSLLREIRDSVREDLILIVMSATLDAEPVAGFLGGCPVIRAEGRTHPVQVRYRPSARPASAETVLAVVEETLREVADSGHVLVFLPGTEEIRRAERELSPLSESHGLEILPLHGSLSAEDQDRALRPSRSRKVVLATNIAETSLTIDGVRTVIDAGLARTASYDPERGLDQLQLGRISRASAEQRAGRAGRTAPGRCVRLWSEAEHRGLSDADVPEAARIDLAPSLLLLHAWGAADPSRFAWFEAPPPGRIAAAEGLLRILGALDETNQLTPLGRRLHGIPAHPRIARLLLAAAEAGHPREGAALAALLSEKDIITRDGSAPAHAGGRGGSDVLTRLDLFREAERQRFSPRLRDQGVDPGAARQVARARDQFERIARRIPSNSSFTLDDEDVLLWILLAYPDRVARRRGSEATGVMVGGRGVRLDRSSVVRDADFFVALDPREDRRSAGAVREARVRVASAIRLEWLEEHFPAEIRRERSVLLDPEKRRPLAVVSVLFRDLVLKEDRNARITASEASETLMASLATNAEEFIRQDESAASWLARYDLLRGAMPELALPPFEEEDYREAASLACQGKASLEEVRGPSLTAALRARLNHVQSRALDEHVPETLTVPSGSRIRVAYERDRPPVLAVRLQELFGWRETPRLAAGRVPLVLHLLGPNYRPVQVTGDLRSFWATTYFQVRKDLRARYPRHSWPDDPLSAKPEAKGGRRG